MDSHGSCDQVGDAVVHKAQDFWQVSTYSRSDPWLLSLMRTKSKPKWGRQAHLTTATFILMESECRGNRRASVRCAFTSRDKSVSSRQPTSDRFMVSPSPSWSPVKWTGQRTA